MPPRQPYARNSVVTVFMCVVYFARLSSKIRITFEVLCILICAATSFRNVGGFLRVSTPSLSVLQPISPMFRAPSFGWKSGIRRWLPPVADGEGLGHWFHSLCRPGLPRVLEVKTRESSPAMYFGKGSVVLHLTFWVFAQCSPAPPSRCSRALGQLAKMSSVPFC